MGKQLGYHAFQDWYSITHQDIEKHGGSGLISNHYNNSPVTTLLSLYPEFDWEPWKFVNLKLPRSIWGQEGKYGKKILTDMSKCLGISSLDDWYRVSLNDLALCRGADLYIKKRGGLMKFLLAEYPDHSWDQRKFSNRQKKSVTVVVVQNH